MPRRSPVLVVDDEADIRDGLRALLVGDGYDVAEAGDGQAALDYLRSHPAPGLILLDWNTAPMNGAQFLVEVAREPALAAIPVVLVSADVRVSRGAPAQRFAGVLNKPIDLEALFELVSRYCAGSP